MKLRRGKKVALTVFGVFLVFMAVCTVVAKGIYAAGLPRVSTSKPYSGSITHMIEVNATVKQGQEYGVYVEAGLRVDTVSVDKGDFFREGDALFRIETNDLADYIAQRKLEIAKLEAQQAEVLRAGSYDRDRQQTAAVRAKEDYDQVVRDADVRIAKCERELEAAQRELALYDQYLREAEEADRAEAEEPGGEQDEDGGEVALSSGQLQEVLSQVEDCEENYNRQEKRLQLEQKVVACLLTLEEARRQKEKDILAAARQIQDAETAKAPDVSSADLLSLDAAYQRERLAGLEALLEAEGWVYAEASGRVVDCRLETGERVPDSACILYALDEGKRVMNAVFTREESKHISVGTVFEVKAFMPDGSRGVGTALLEDQEEGEDGNSYAKLSFEGLALEIGQSAQLSYKQHSETYSTCISRMSLQQESENDYSIFVVEEHEGILGTEWKVRKVRVNVLDQNDTVVAIQSADISLETRVVSGTTKPLADGMTVRVVQ